MISFKGKHYPKDVILFAVYFYVRYAVSYHDLEEIMAERSVDIDHATLNRWEIEYGSLLAEEAQKRKQQTASSWRTLIEVPLVTSLWLSTTKRLGKEPAEFQSPLPHGFMADDNAASCQHFIHHPKAERKAGITRHSEP